MQVHVIKGFNHPVPVGSRSPADLRGTRYPESVACQVPGGSGYKPGFVATAERGRERTRSDPEGADDEHSEQSNIVENRVNINKSYPSRPAGNCENTSTVHMGLERGVEHVAVVLLRNKKQVEITYTAKGM